MLQVNNLTFSYDKDKILEDISFQVNKGEHLAIIGESGSGKSTLLKLIYGDYDIAQGQIYWNNTQILGPKYNLVIGYEFVKRVTQEFDLMPYTTVEENISKHLSRFFLEDAKKRTKELIKVVQLEAFTNKKVKTLSGGQKQRVALARALAKTPEILLLDEPFSHIDNFKKQSLRRNIFNYLKANNITCIIATHHKDDVLGFSDQMIVLHNKRIIAKKTPINLYKNPKFPLIASFFEEFSIIADTIYYAHQLKIVEASNLKVTVKKAYFNGSCWLIEALLDTSTIYIEHHSFIKTNTEVYITLEE